MTNHQRLTITLTLFNLILLAFGLAQLRPVPAKTVSVGPRRGLFRSPDSCP
jgi:hypothetical protein